MKSTAGFGYPPGVTLAPLDAARAALAIARLLWLTRTSGARHGQRLPDSGPLREVSAELGAAVAAAEAAPAGTEEHVAALARASMAIEKLWELVGPADSIQGLLSAAGRIVEGRPMGKAPLPPSRNGQ